MTERYDAIIIGSGMAGAMAANRLAASGRSVLVLEARPRVGGRTYYRQFPQTDVSIELGGGWVLPQLQPRLASALTRFGIHTVSSPEPASLQWRLAGAERVGECPLTGFETTRVRRALAQLVAMSKLCSGGPDETLSLALLDRYDTSFGSWLDGQDLPAVPRALLSAWVSNWFGAPEEEFSLCNPLIILPGFNNDPYLAYGSLSSQIAGGTKCLVTALLDSPRISVATNSQVTDVCDGASAVTVRLADGRQVRGARCVVTLPVNTLAQVLFDPALPPEVTEVAQRKHAGRAYKVFARISGISQVPFVVSDTGPFIKVRPMYRLSDGWIVMGIGHDPGFSIEDSASVAAGFRDALGNVTVGTIDVHDWNADNFSAGAWVSFRPGQASHVLSSLASPRGRIAFAGSDISLRWNGWIEGALWSAERAAELVLRSREQ